MPRRAGGMQSGAGHGGHDHQRQGAVVLIEAGGERRPGAAVQDCGVADGEEVAAALVRDLDRLAGRRAGIEVAGEPIVAPQRGADEPASGQDRRGAIQEGDAGAVGQHPAGRDLRR